MRVRLEILKGGVDRGEDNEIVGEIYISNNIVRSIQTDGTRGDYKATVFKKRRGIVFKTVRVRDYPRKAYHPWELVRRILNEAF